MKSKRSQTGSGCRERTLVAESSDWLWDKVSN